MQAIFCITKREIKSYLISPKAGVMFTVFLFLMGLFFYIFMSHIMSLAMNPQGYAGGGISLEQVFRALFSNLYIIFLFIVPAITMSVFSDEKKNQTIKFLYSSPISIWDIVLGKYLATIIMIALMLGASFVYPLFTMYYGNPDNGVLFSSYLGLFLLVLAQLSLGLWISSIVKNQFLSFLFTMLSLFLLLIINWLATSGASGIMSDFLQYLAFSPHLENYLKGMISVSDTVYFLSFIGLFLYFSYVSLDSQRWS